MKNRDWNSVKYLVGRMETIKKEMEDIREESFRVLGTRNDLDILMKRADETVHDVFSVLKLTFEEGPE